MMATKRSPGESGDPLARTTESTGCILLDVRLEHRVSLVRTLDCRNEEQQLGTALPLLHLETG